MAGKGGLKIKLDGESYEIDFDKVSLGEARVLKQQFGLEDFSSFNFFDPDQLVGVIAVAVKRAHPELDDDEVLAKVEGLENGPIFTALNKQVEEAMKKADPQTAGGAKTAPATNGAPATSRKTRGPQSSPST